MHGNGTFELSHSLLAALAHAPLGLSIQAMARAVMDHDPRLIGWVVDELRSAGLIEEAGGGFYRITPGGVAIAVDGWSERQ